MTKRERERVSVLAKRRDRLAERVRGYRRDGDPNLAKAELGALNWALRIIEAAEAKGILHELAGGRR